MVRFFKRKLASPDLHFAGKGYVQIAVTKKYRPDIDLHNLELGYASDLLREGCSIEQAWSARWGGVLAIHAEPSEFDDALQAARDTRQEMGMPQAFRDKDEAQAIYLASAEMVVTLTHTLDSESYQRFLDYIGAA